MKRKEELEKTVRKGYAKIVKKKSSCCAPSSYEDTLSNINFLFF